MMDKVNGFVDALSNLGRENVRPMLPTVTPHFIPVTFNEQNMAFLNLPDPLTVVGADYQVTESSSLVGGQPRAGVRIIVSHPTEPIKRQLWRHAFLSVSNLVPISTPMRLQAVAFISVLGRPDADRMIYSVELDPIDRVPPPQVLAMMEYDELPLRANNGTTTIPWDKLDKADQERRIERATVELVPQWMEMAKARWAVS